ncbi:lysylphosphatidylglycerol synthase domain-containing protein [Roseibacterium sp. SDUM158017]|uniref:lysylphosphatidylglycerol synthase domain-containing protein n=1 Tax=Roseicyclus salinarum TaxID=3036773 RepID=UPI002414E61C|nr:lysylphosphatidylglycerol synthase domain-containing protein [Roseibacterium sp. SDUM158017]MDG4650162.1 lysylphosphatidylglycerol synthase domain-containing protein [Roseibacterium sp. SDUM158017]
MILARRAAGVAASTGLGLFLVWLLFSFLPVSPGEAVVAALSAPPWLYAVVTCLTLANLVVGALKWQVAADHLAQPVRRTGFLRRVELTSLGEFFGQLIPVQLSTLLVRWVLLDREVRASGYVARATIFEQAFDLILVLSGSVAAIAVIGFDLAAGPAVATMAAMVAASLVALRACLRGGERLLRALDRRGVRAGGFAAAADGFAHAAAAPAAVLATLSLYSLLRLVLVALRAGAVLAVLAPSTAIWLVFVASPPIALLTSLPIAPAGLGMAEWSWSAVLVHGGTAASVAAVAALGVRLTNMVALCVIVGGLTLLRRIGTRRADARGSGA